MLFRVLEDDLFRLFSGKYACAYAALLERLHGGLFSVEAIDQPTRQEVLRELGEGLASFMAAAPPEVAADSRLVAADAYAELMATGWLSEQREGWTVYVEMGVEAAKVLERLCTLSEPAADTFGGTMVSVLRNLEGAVADPETSALGVSEAARRARDFARYIRSVVGTLKGIEAELLSQAEVNGLVRTFFERFVERIVVGDYRNLTLAGNHPYQFKYRINDLLDDIQSDRELLDRLCRGLVSQGVAADAGAAAAQLARHMQAVRGAIESIEGFRWRIDRTKSNIERRFNNTLRYMDLLETGLADRFTSALSRLGTALGRRHGGFEIAAATILAEPLAHFDSGRLAVPTAARRAVEPQRYRQPEPDPLRVAFDRAKSDFDRRITITPQKFMTYVRRKMAAAPRVTAAEIPPGDIEEFVIFSALRALPPGSARLPDGTMLRPLDGQIENDWMVCGDFELVRGRGRDAR